MPDPSRRDERASPQAALQAKLIGRFAAAALAAGAGEACALFRRGFYLRCLDGGYACIGDASLAAGPLHVVIAGGFPPPRVGDRVPVDTARAAEWRPPAASFARAPELAAFAAASAAAAPREGLACLLSRGQNALASHLQPALDALSAWLAGHALGAPAEELIGAGPGATPAGDDYLGGVLVALRACGRAALADSLWRWLQPRLAGRTSALSAAHLAAAAAGETHEGVHACLALLAAADGGDLGPALARLDAAPDTSAWDALAGAVAVLRSA